MAPELLSGQPYSEKVDIFGFGMIFYELLEREWAWNNVDEGDVVDRVLDGERPKLSSWVPKECVDLYDRTIDQDQNKRPSSKSLITAILQLPHATWREPPNESLVNT